MSLLPSRSISLGWIAVGAFGVLVIVVLVLGLRSQRDADRWIDHTLEVEGALQGFEASINGMSGELRGYVLTHQPTWADSYRQHGEEASGDVAHIRELTADNPVQRAQVSFLERELRAQSVWGGRILADVQRGDANAGTALVASGQGEAELVKLRDTVRQMWGEEERLLRVREIKASRLRRLGLGLAVLAGGLMTVQSLITLGFLRARLRSYEREQVLLRQSQEYAESIVATVREPLLVIDAGMRVVSANRSFYLRFGLTAAETEGAPLTELGGGPWNIPSLMERLHRVFEDGGEMENFALEHEFPRLGRRHLLMSARKVYRPGNHTGRILLAIEDDTERERSAERLRQINAELEGFAYTVAHDLRAPLRGMQGFAEALTEDYGAKLDDAGRTYIQHIASAARRMDDLIRDLLEYSRLSRAEVKLDRVELAQVVSAARQQVGESLARKGAEIRVEEPLPTVTGHFPILVQIVANLLENGAKFVAPGATPRLTVRSEPRRHRQRLWVEDNGIGIAPQFHERIFRVFERLHGQETYPGTGIGLAVVRKGAERMGAEVGVESAPGQGSRFWIDLPEATA